MIGKSDVRNTINQYVNQKNQGYSKGQLHKNRVEYLKNTINQMKRENKSIPEQVAHLKSLADSTPSGLDHNIGVNTAISELNDKNLFQAYFGQSLEDYTANTYAALLIFFAIVGVIIALLIASAQ